ncbi:hypothetical protein PYCCODRAFT_1374060 [Trametes coccinea BRFM310]|uniref:RBR-type E3 ubiquitin transferase n=1 Tax=Trametes coccinea (strain BRFM310) TaxID=1353009 RepID=A0A1Y2ICZ6_TRAC3|nr:hypothetical protein PYCCODRAFT_1374060 [Trametes coccinea BRFM310]
MSTGRPQDILRPCLSWSNPTHLAVDDIYLNAPAFQKSLVCEDNDYGNASRKFLRKLIEKLAGITQERGVSACVIITRPPEIIACFSIADAGSSPLFIIFDSHPRPDKHPEGAAFIFHRSISASTAYLADLLKYDADVVRELGIQWEAQLLTQCSGDFFIASESRLTAEQWAQTALQASLQAVGIQARVREVELTNQELLAERKRLNGEVRALERDLLRSVDALQREKARTERYRKEISDRTAALANLRAARSSSENAGGPPSNSLLDFFRPENVWTIVGRSQRQGTSGASQSQSRTSNKKGKSSDHQAGPDDLAVALEAQLAFDKENEELKGQLAELQRAQPKFFDCGICLETYQEDHVAIVRPCDHICCRACLKTHTVTKVEEYSYPILCPLCIADRSSTAYGVQSLGLTEKQYDIFVEMQMLKFSIMITCRSCAQSVFVDKAEFEASKIIHCPLAGCGYAWCKQCSQAVEFAGPEHSCDGSKELEHVMKQRGWKQCPGCNTPTERISGCNHMTCGAPGCNSHFCYSCGQLIVRSGLPRDLTKAISAHYARCNLR